MNVKKSICECGHGFALKRRVSTCFDLKRRTRELKIAKIETRAIETTREAKKRQVKDSASRALAGPLTKVTFNSGQSN